MFCRRGTDEVPGWGAVLLDAGDPKEDWPSRDRIQRFVSRLFETRQITKSRLPVGEPERRPGCVPQWCYRPAWLVRIVHDGRPLKSACAGVQSRQFQIRSAHTTSALVNASTRRAAPRAGSRPFRGPRPSMTPGEYPSADVAAPALRVAHRRSSQSGYPRGAMPALPPSVE